MQSTFRFFLLLIILGSASCQPDSEQNTEDTSVRLFCQSGDTADEMPTHAVYAIVGYNKVKIATFNACDSIPPNDYQKLNIPEEALAAVGGQWEGSANYLYALKEGEAINFYDAYPIANTEPGAAAHQYRKVGTFRDGKFNLELPLSRSELVGTYALSLEKGSHILFVGMSEDQLIAEYFRPEGILPPVNQLNLLMGTMQSDSLANFSLDTNSMSFSSDIGNGKFVRTAGGGINAILYPADSQDRLILDKILSKDYSIPVE